MSPRQIKQLSLEALGFNLVARNRLVRWVHQMPGVELSAKKCKELASSTTVAQVMLVIEKESFWKEDGSVANWSAVQKMFRAKLLELGMIVDDWAYLAPSPKAVMDHLVRGAAKGGKKHLLPLNLRMLGRSISRDVVANVETLLSKTIDHITIGDLVCAENTLWQDKYFRRRWHQGEAPFFEQKLKYGLIVARKKLLALGFRYEDGYFFQIGTKKLLVKKVAEDLKISRARSEKVIDYARENGWGPKVQFKD